MRVHIQREGYGRQPGLCGALPTVMHHGGPATADCKRCLKAAALQGWLKDTHPLAARMVQQNYKRVGVEIPAGSFSVRG